jgi:CRP-like cAMP-binding protein
MFLQRTSTPSRAARRCSSAAGAGAAKQQRRLQPTPVLLRQGAAQDKGAAAGSSKKLKAAMDRIDLLSKVPLFFGISPAQLKKVADSMEVMLAAAGQIIIEQGDTGDEMYVVETGKLEASVITKDGKRLGVVKEYTSGTFFGELALLSDAGTLRSATVTAAVRSGLLILRRESVADMLQKGGLYRTLGTVPLFAGLDHTKLHKIATSLVKRHVARGRVVIKQGDSGDEMFVVESGRLEASVVTPEGKDIGVVKTYGGGEYFGELALISDEPRSATITATDEGTLLVLQRAVVTELLQDLYRTLGTVPLFAGLDHTKLRKIATSLVKRQVTPGQVVIKQGDSGDEMFVVESGRLEASVVTPEGKDIGVVKTYGGGEYFGELALMSDERRSATVTATDESTLLVLQRAVVTQLLQDLHGTELSGKAAAEVLDVEFQKALKRRGQRRGAVVQQKDLRTGLVKLASNSTSQINPLRRAWANEQERAKETDMRAVSSKNKLSTVSELHAAALAGDLTWVQRVIEPEAEACSILRQVEPEVARRRR